MRTIYKYPFQVTDRVGINLPVGAVVLRIACEEGAPLPCLWAAVDTEAKVRHRTFYVVGTGRRIPDDVTLRHVASFDQAPFVWHVFEEE